MASTNTRTNSDTVLSADIYEIAEFYDEIRQNNIPNLDDTSAMVGIFGYMNEMFTQTMQNTIVMVSETTNETLPTRAKFTKNIITHALNLGVTDIYAKPAVMTIMIYLPLSYMETNYIETTENNARKTRFILSKDIPIFIDKYEYHLDYDVIINRIVNTSNANSYTYTAMYDLFENGTTNIKQQNPISDINNPYINTLIQTSINGTEFIAFSARVHQVELNTIDKNILTSNSIENKTITFDYEGQLASFNVEVIESGDKTVNITPIFNGLLNYTVEDVNWCYFDYISDKTIRLIFNRDSYIPPINSIVRVKIYLCDGSDANFTYTQSFRIALKSEEYNNYNGMYALIYPLQNGISAGGKDAKSISDLKKIIPREASSRGAIINTTDLNNFFNSINDSNSKLYFKKKRDNPFERMYYAYILLRKNGNIYPTNTISLKIKQTDFIGNAGNNNLSINPGTVFYYYNHGIDSDDDYATLVHPEYYETDEDLDYPVTRNEAGDLVRVYKYITPFLITIDDDLLASYFLTVMNESKTFSFDSINTDSDLQFVATNMQWVRNFYYNDNDSLEQVYDKKYTMTVDIAQNNIQDYNLVKYHYDANAEVIFDDIRVKMYIVLYSDNKATNPYRYAEAELVRFDEARFSYTFRFTFETDDLMDLHNRINIKGIYNAKPEELQKIINLDNSHGYMNSNTYAKIFILADFGTRPGDNVDGNIITEDTAQNILYGDNGNRTEIESIIPTRKDVISQLLTNELYIQNEDGSQVSIVSIIKSNQAYLNAVMAYNGNELQTTQAIVSYLRNNADSDYVQNTILKDEKVLAIINAYSYEDLDRYTVCNTLSVDGGIDFYYNYTEMMTSNVNANAIKSTDNNGDIIYKEHKYRDASGNEYSEYKPVYEMNESGMYNYEYKISRIPVIKDGYLSTERLVQEFLYDIEARRRYIEECLYTLEETFSIDLKFVNTFGPSRTFYYNIPSSQNFKSKVIVKRINVYSSTVDESTNIVGELLFDQIVNVVKVKGQWGYIKAPYEGWIKLSDTVKLTNFIDNVAVNLKFALQAQTSADKYVADDIVQDIKAYIEDINEINELHMPNIVTLITNNYREQLEYFEFLDVNGYGAACQHLYLYERNPDIADIAPEFINVETKNDAILSPKIDITVY